MVIPGSIGAIEGLIIAGWIVLAFGLILIYWAILTFYYIFIYYGYHELYCKENPEGLKDGLNR